MTIGIDASPAYRKNKTGIEWYAWHITKGLVETQNEQMQFCVYTDKSPNDGIPGVKPIVLNWPSKYFWQEFRLSWEMLAHRPDILFVPSRALPLMLPKKTITTIHDVGFIRYPDERKALSREYLIMTSRRAAQVATKILTVSEFSKREIIELFGISPEKIGVTYLGYDHASYIPLGTQQSHERPYILCIGRRERRKNQTMLVRAYEILKEQMGKDTPRLIIQGPRGHHAAELDEVIAKSSAVQDITVTDWVSEEEKVRLLQRAWCLVHPSLYEGFGLPVIEAQACGIPVVCSSAAALPEITGDGGLFFNPKNSEEMASQIRRVCIEVDTRKKLIENGLKNAQRFSWKTTVARTLEIITSNVLQ